MLTKSIWFQISPFRRRITINSRTFSTTNNSINEEFNLEEKEVSKIQKSPEDLSEEIKGLSNKIKEFYWKILLFLEIIKELLSFLKEESLEIIKGLSEEIKNSIRKFFNSKESGSDDKEVSKIQKSPEDLSEEIKGLSEDFNFEESGSDDKEVSKIQKSPEDLSKKVKVLSEEIEKISKEIDKSSKEIKERLSLLKIRTVEEIKNFIRKFFNSKESGSNDKEVSKIQKSPEDLSKKVKEQLSDQDNKEQPLEITKGLSEEIKELSKAIKNFIGKFYQKISITFKLIPATLILKLTNFVSFLWNKLTDFVSFLWNKFGKWSNDLFLYKSKAESNKLISPFLIWKLGLYPLWYPFSLVKHKLLNNDGNPVLNFLIEYKKNFFDLLRKGSIQQFREFNIDRNDRREKPNLMENKYYVQAAAFCISIPTCMVCFLFLCFFASIWKFLMPFNTLFGSGINFLLFSFITIPPAITYIALENIFKFFPSFDEKISDPSPSIKVEAKKFLLSHQNLNKELSLNYLDEPAIMNFKKKNLNLWSIIHINNLEQGKSFKIMQPRLNLLSDTGYGTLPENVQYVNSKFKGSNLPLKSKFPIFYEPRAGNEKDGFFKVLRRQFFSSTISPRPMTKVFHDEGKTSPTLKICEILGGLLPWAGKGLSSGTRFIKDKIGPEKTNIQIWGSVGNKNAKAQFLEANALKYPIPKMESFISEIGKKSGTESSAVRFIYLISIVFIISVGFNIIAQTRNILAEKKRKESLLMVLITAIVLAMIFFGISGSKATI